MKICPTLAQFPDVKHGFFEGRPKAFFLEPKKTVEVGGLTLACITLNQIHSDIVHLVEGEETSLQDGDGLVTTQRGIALGIITADCGPILFYDPRAQVIGACHAGWRGARVGILQKTLAAMEALGAKKSRIYATLGPTIQQENYEVGPEFPELIGSPYEDFFVPSLKKGHHFFNLPRYITDQLLEVGVKTVNDIEVDTYTSNYASRRRTLHEENREYSSANLSLIAIV